MSERIPQFSTYAFQLVTLLKIQPELGRVTEISGDKGVKTLSDISREDIRYIAQAILDRRSIARVNIA